ncbi:MAG: hypothetical protein JO328_21560 [Hyphomicrobiales bacterium]|nr:hypothetical protein [Hyphomicrobiales bacterium]
MRLHAAQYTPPLPQKRFAEVPRELLARAAARKAFLTIPEEWKRREVSIPGSVSSYYWQGVLHIHNADMMRHLGPFPPRRPGVFRIAIVGDSLTYGYGIDESDTFTHLLDDWLSEGGRVEALNLGVPGAQSEDIVKVIEKSLPELKPDLFVYAVCENDYLPSGVAQYSSYYAVPLPDSVKDFLISHSMAVEFTSDLYDAALRRLHLRADFFDDILADFNGYQQGFDNNLIRMSTAVEKAGLPPIIGVVLDQYPTYGGTGYQIARVAERAMRRAGFDVIETESYYRNYNNTAFDVSRWEGHPNEVAHYIWAKMLAEHLRQHIESPRLVDRPAVVDRP